MKNPLEFFKKTKYSENKPHEKIITAEFEEVDEISLDELLQERVLSFEEFYGLLQHMNGLRDGNNFYTSIGLIDRIDRVRGIKGKKLGIEIVPEPLRKKVQELLNLEKAQRQKRL